MKKLIVCGSVLLAANAAMATEIVIRVTYADQEFKEFSGSQGVELPVKTKGWKCHYLRIPKEFSQTDIPSGMVSCGMSGSKVSIGETVMCMSPASEVENHIYESIQRRDFMLMEMTPQKMGQGTHITVSCKF